MGINTIRVPLDGIICTCDGRFYIRLDGKLTKVVYVHDVKCWFIHTETDKGWVLENPVWQDSSNNWIEGNKDIFATRPFKKSMTYMEIKLPPIHKIPKNASPVPDCIHYIWIGKGRMPEEFVENIHANIKKASGLKHYLHLHIFTEAGLEEIKEQFSSEKNLIINNLCEEKWFNKFLKSELGHYYSLFLDGISFNLAAACDILRLVILQKTGGIYLDVDNTIVSEIHSSAKLYASTNDMLFNEYHNYIMEYEKFVELLNNSVFACTPGSKLVKKILGEVLHQLKNNQWIFETPRPVINKNMSKKQLKELRDYGATIMHLTGPCSYIRCFARNKKNLLELFECNSNTFTLLNFSNKEPRVIFEEYTEQLQHAKAYYFPFGKLNFLIREGGARTWFSREHMPLQKKDFPNMSGSA